MSNAGDTITPAEHRDRWNELADELGRTGEDIRGDLSAMWDAAGPDERVELVAARGGATLNEIGSVMGVSRERVRQIEFGALAKLRARGGDSIRRLLAEVDAARNGAPRYYRSGSAIRQSDPIEMPVESMYGCKKAIDEGFDRLPARLRPAGLTAARRRRFGDV